jgi:hypothetical protein
MAQNTQNENSFQYLDRIEMYAADAILQPETNSETEPLDLIMNLLDSFLLHASE